MSRTTTDALYLVTIVTFILALRFLSSPKHARKGNWIGAAGMALAIVVTLAQDGLGNYGLIAAGMVAGGAVGLIGARTVKMTAMPQMVALFNGVGGGAAALIALDEFHRYAGELSTVEATSTALSALIGAVSFSGSLIAFAKLQELISGRPIVFHGQQIVNGLIIATAVALGVAISAGADTQGLIYGLIAAALVFGVMFVLPIGGADMPVVISLLNAFTGLAASATGFVLHNNVLIVAGALVGASGTLLTMLMGKAMNRSITNVLFGAFGQVQAGAGTARADDGRTVRATSPEDVAVMLSYARKVIVVPGYGLAVAQAQHDVRQLAELLEEKGVDVVYAIHPVAGRMPGHMNVLLAEANVPYDQLKEMDEVNPEFPQADVALVIGANDVTNPSARTDTASPIYGMPILDVDKAASVVVMKRSMAPGFAGIDNELYLDPRTTMLFGDAKDSIVKLIGAVKAFVGSMTVGITDEAALRALLGEPAALVRAKVSNHLNELTRRFIELSPFMLLATSSADGTCDVSPRGDPAGFVQVLDERALLVPERPGNRLADSLRNILANSHVGLLFLIPGVGDTLRVNGRATIVTDDELLQPLAVEGKTPKLGLLIDVDEVFTHCSKAFLRSQLWDVDRHVDRSELPSSGEIHRSLDPSFDAETYDAERAGRYARREGFY